MRGALATLTTALTGMLAGGMIFIEAVLVPSWRHSSPREFREWFAVNSGRIRALMVPLGAGSVAVGSATAIADALGDDGPSATSALAAGAAAAVVTITVTVSEPANEKFEQVDFDDAETTRLLGRWARWHHVRVALGLVSFVSAALSLRRA
jgi:uncharacterized membrane protein